MKYDFSKVLKNIDGTDAIEADGPATAYKGFRSALVTDTQGTTSADKAAKFALFMKLSPTENELSVEEAALLKKAADVFPTLVYGQLCAILDQAN